MREREPFVITPARRELVAGVEKQSLLQSFGERKFSPKQTTAINVLDSTQYPLWEKRLFFFYYLWEDTGSFSQIKKFGDIRVDSINSMIDRVMGSQDLGADYDKFYEAYELTVEQSLNQKISKLEKKVLSLKREKIKHEEIARKLKISKISVHEISKTLIGKGLIEPSPLGMSQAQKFEEFLKQVEDLDDPKVTDREIARRLNATLSRVERARKRLRMQGRIWDRTPKDVAQSQKKSRELLPLRDRVRELSSVGLTIRQIVALTGATEQQVKHQRVILRKQKSKQQ